MGKFKPLEHQTLAELREERAYWQSQLDQATGWGAAVGVASGYRDGCDAWIKKREAEAPTNPSIASGGEA